MAIRPSVGFDHEHEHEHDFDRAEGLGPLLGGAR